jgi:hypothetical protein
VPTKPEAISLLDRHLQPEHLEPGNVQKNSRDSCTTLLHMLVYIVDLQTTPLIKISICNILFCTSELPFRLFDGGQCVLYRTPRQILYRTSSAFDLRIVHIYRFNTENICVPFFWRKARRFPSCGLDLSGVSRFMWVLGHALCGNFAKSTCGRQFWNRNMVSLASASVRIGGV